MKFRQLGNTDIKVSVICLGTMNWGEQNSEKDAHNQLNYTTKQGINFIDTAELYAVPPRQESQGLTETYIGNWLAKRGKRDDLIIASKVTGPSDRSYMRKGQEDTRLTKKQIQEAIDSSLKRLQTDYLDLYQVHWPERETNFFGPRGYFHQPNRDGIPIEETLEALTDLVKQGKTRYIGVSNETAWGVMEYLRLHREKHLEGIVSIQNPYSLIMRDYETSLAEISLREQVSLLVYSPLSGGVLSGKYLGGKFPEGSRFHYSKRNNDRYNPPQAQEAIKAYVDLAKKHHLDPSQMALAFVNSRQFVTSNIIGATTIDQLKVDIDSINIDLSTEILGEIEAIHTRLPSPIA